MNGNIFLTTSCHSVQHLYISQQNHFVAKVSCHCTMKSLAIPTPVLSQGNSNLIVPSLPLSFSPWSCISEQAGRPLFCLGPNLTVFFSYLVILKPVQISIPIVRQAKGLTVILTYYSFIEWVWAAVTPTCLGGADRTINTTFCAYPHTLQQKSKETSLTSV